MGVLDELLRLLSPFTPFICEELWQKRFFENGPNAFERKNAAPEGHLQRTIAALRDKLQRKNEVVAELMEEHIKLKKELGEL